MPIFSSRAAALALGMSPKELDNLLSRHAVYGLEPSTRGRDRRLRPEMIVRLAVSSVLREAFGCSWDRAIELTQPAFEQSEFQLCGTAITVRIDIALIRDRLSARLSDASEYLLAPRRGRPVRAALSEISSPTRFG